MAEAELSIAAERAVTAIRAIFRFSMRASSSFFDATPTDALSESRNVDSSDV